MKKNIIVILLMITHTLFCILSGAFGWELQLLIVMNLNIAAITTIYLLHGKNLKLTLFCILPFYLIYVPASIYLKSYTTYPIWALGIIISVVAYLMIPKKNWLTTALVLLLIEASGHFFIMPNNFSYVFQENPEQFDLKDAKIENESGNRVSIPSLKGKIVLFDIWSTGCTSCIKKFPKLEALKEEFKQDTLVRICSLNISTDSADRAFCQQITAKYSFNKLYFNKKEEAKRLSIEAVPLVLILDKENKCRYAGDLNTEWNIVLGNARRIIQSLKKEI